jgi:ABC-2 type transport system permease protein
VSTVSPARAPRLPAPAPAPHAAPSTARSLAAVIVRGLRDQRRAALYWGGGFGLLCALMAAIWPSIEDSMTQLVESYPEGLLKAFGISRLDSVERYIDAEMLSVMVPLGIAFLAVRCATRATVGAEERGHLDTLLSLPLSRRVVVLGSYAVTAIVVAAALGVMAAVTWIAGTLAGTGISASALAAGFGNVWPLAMAFAGLAALVAGLSSRPVVVIAVAGGTLVAMYVVDLVGKLSDAVEPLRAVSAFRYYGSAIQQGFDVSHALGLTLAGIVLAVAGAVLFERRDLR